MSLRIRRGTNAERSGVTFLEGELVYTTDTKKMFVGDGTTVGGIAVDSTVGSINQMSDVNIVGIQTGQILQWDGSQFIAGDDQGDKERVTGADSTILVDATNSSINLDGTVKGHIIPDQNETYNLGSASKKFNDLFLSGTTITLGTATISSTGGEITLSQPINAEVKSTGNIDTNDNTITNTAAGGNITVAPTAGKQFRIDDTVGGTSFSVDTTAKSVDIHNGYGLKLATFASADYTAIAGSEQAGQIVFDNPTKTLKLYNGSGWTSIAGGGAGGSGIVEGQTYDINISGDIIGTDSTIIFNQNTKNINVQDITTVTLDVNGSAFADDLTVTTDVNAVNFIASGSFDGNLEGNVKGNVKAANGSTVLTAGTDGFNATFRGSVDGDVQGSVFGNDSSIIIDGINSEVVGKINAQEILKVAVPDSVGTSNAIQIFNFNGSVDNPSEPGDFDKRSIKFRDYNGTSFYDSAIIAGYHQTAGGGYIGISPVSQDNLTLFDTALELDGNARTIKIAGGIVGSVQTISGPGAINVTSLHTAITTTGADAYTLANGVVGQVKIISMAVDGGDATITPTTFANGSTITFEDVNDCITLLYTANGWLSIANQGSPVIA